MSEERENNLSYQKGYYAGKRSADKDVAWLIEERERLKAENAKLRDDLSFYQLEAVARTNTDARSKP